jgi:hypothetical protein
MIHSDNLVAALKALGYAVTLKGSNDISAETDSAQLRFTRYAKDEAFKVSGDTDYLSAIGRKYAEVGVRNWAKRSQFNVLDNDGVQMTLVNRRSI